MIFRENEDIRECLEALRDHLEDIPERGPEGAEGFLDRLAGELRTELAGLIFDPLDTPSDCARLFHRYRGDDYLLALVRALARVLDVRTRLARPAWLPAGRPWSCVTWGEAAEELQAAFADVLSQQAQANERILAAKEESRRKGARRGGQKRKTVELKGIILMVLRNNPRMKARELWEYLQKQRRFRGELDGKEFVVTVSSDDILAIQDAETRKEIHSLEFKAFQHQLTEVRKKFLKKNPGK